MPGPPWIAISKFPEAGSPATRTYSMMPSLSTVSSCGLVALELEQAATRMAKTVPNIIMVKTFLILLLPPSRKGHAKGFQNDMEGMTTGCIRHKVDLVVIVSHWHKE